MSARKILRFITVLLVCVLSVKSSYADHLKGGWIKYSYLGSANGSAQYQITFYQYSDCSQPEKVDGDIYLSIYDAATSKEIGGAHKVHINQVNPESKGNFGPCFQNQPVVCYLVAEYDLTVSLPLNAGGYVVAVQRCCRIEGIKNVPNSNNVGLTYTLTIPGGSSYTDNSPVFEGSDLVAICYNSPFTLDFSATDIDKDSMVYSLCSGLTGGTSSAPQVGNPPPPPYSTIPYSYPYSGGQPLGASVTIDRNTGIVSGLAPAQLGTYVLAVCVDEYRNGTYIGHTRKEIHLDVANCSIGGASLNPSYITCDGFNFTFKNNSAIDPSYSYFWDFGVDSLTTDTSSLPNPSFTYHDTGVYTVRLKANNNKGCEDSAKAQVSIFPGFKTDFSINASCIKYPYAFKDLTMTKYGVVDSWQWFFDSANNYEGTAILTPDAFVQDPTYMYSDTGLKTVILVTTNSKGCIDTARQILHVTNGPDLAVNFRDTLICNVDTLQLRSSSTTQGATFSWSPSYNIINANNNNPLIYPKQTTLYAVNVAYKGCEATDSVLVNVIDHVDLALPGDTTICKTDSINLTPTTNALYFSWSPASTLNNSFTEYPKAAPLTNTTYAVRASVGKCYADAAMNVKVVPYPIAAAGNDVSICYGATTQLNATMQAAYFNWSPSNSLIDPNTLTPVAGPQATTDYVLQVTDTLGCPKPVYDTVTVKVIPKVIAFAGNDTNVVRSQPVQLHATGATNYLWYPVSGLSNPNIADPILTLSDQADTVLYSVKVSTPEGCFSTDSIKIFIFNTEPQVFIPTAFTPNGDGKNDVFRPTVAGMQQFKYLRIYNRWGQLLFETARSGDGWDGNFKGNKQPSGTYVFSIEAIDYKNKPYVKKGTFVLIR